MTLLPELATEARRINAANGWGTDFDPDKKRDEVPSYLALIHSEITEAWTAKFPRDASRELGDVIIRALDLGELLQPGYWQDCHQEFCEIGQRDYRRETWVGSLMGLHVLTSEALEIYRKETPYRPGLLQRLHVLVSESWRLMERYPTDLPPERIIRDILRVNSQRGYRHGGRRT
ncbi:hypothetical protein [Deinococcus sp. 6GRE01]|uniref:hypothetical protein n=1 Tax=Deinococcus sp. 6GRE01 TaxID=2745873 RepID=UPI001E3BB7C1|nr:hypothetical protein [Deinococcus sp. 6GRE01]MCD0155855.1 hypothetical protein [Deinococcus sp. 6GRE01]